jgi:hypothetical protein
MPPKELFEDSEHWYDKEIIQEHQFELERAETFKQGSMIKEASNHLSHEEAEGFVEKNKI